MSQPDEDRPELGPMTDKDIRRFASAVSDIITMYMPRAIEDALDEVELDDLLQDIYNATKRSLERASDGRIAK